MSSVVHRSLTPRQKKFPEILWWNSPLKLPGKCLGRLESRKDRAATELGISTEEVESLPFDLSTLESEGIFMNIDCRGFGSLVRQLEWKTLGVQLPENAAVRVSPPRAGLLPDVYAKLVKMINLAVPGALADFGCDKCLMAVASAKKNQM